MSQSEAALRKKKNADAQAAFRARRANYIATLEETVTNLEAVVLQLQDSYKQAKNEAADLRTENSRLRLEHRERERFWRALWQAKRTGQPPPDGEDFPLPSYSPSHTPVSTVGPSLPYPDMPNAGDPSTSLAATTSYPPGPGPEYAQRSPMVGFAGVEHDVDGRAQQMDAQRMGRYDAYPPYTMESPVRESWPAHDPALENTDPCPSPTYLDSPSLTAADASYAPRFPVNEDQKVPLTPMSSSYMFPTSRSLSPASTPTSNSSTSLAPFPYGYQEGAMHDERADFPYRRQNSGHGPALTLHGGTADIPIAGAGGGYRFGGRPSGTVSGVAPYSRAENGSNERESDEGEAATYHYATRARHRSSTATSRTSRSPSPGSPPPICGTLAVIKAQAFGALRRTRTKKNRTTEGAAKAAVEALEARGIGMGIVAPPKRPRSQAEGDMQM
ncbi:hypothetical protein K474DRAFT_1659826 [Panus rudis PR-1116 ss-1]|nr:hypothetical protein K474DRAFT_1659826 [Panus rudis PR-1116 ss-1]